MVDALMRFHRTAVRENRDRRIRQRYSPALQHQAVEYLHRRRGAQGVRTAAD